jgi:DNA polymerase III delta prime subunit
MEEETSPSSDEQTASTSFYRNCSELLGVVTSSFLKRIRDIESAHINLDDDEEAKQQAREEFSSTIFGMAVLLLRKQHRGPTLDFTKILFGITKWIDSGSTETALVNSVENHDLVEFSYNDPTLITSDIWGEIIGFSDRLGDVNLQETYRQLLSNTAVLLTSTDSRFLPTITTRLAGTLGKKIEGEECEETEDYEGHPTNQTTSSSDSPSHNESVPEDPWVLPDAPSERNGQQDIDPQSKLLSMIDGLVGLDAVKKDIVTISNIAKVQNLRASMGVPNPPYSYHMIFTGNPGTGKTTVARILGKVFKSVNCLSKGHFVECDRSLLVGGYLGETALKTKKVLNAARGGILFIDEAYALTQRQAGIEDNYGKEAIDTILKFMEDNRDDFIVIAAGYKDLMEDFIDANPGLKSRFNKYFHFEDYGTEELHAIFLGIAKDCEYLVTDSVSKHLKKLFAGMDENKDINFGNGRTVRNFFEKCLANQANRLSKCSKLSRDDLMILKKEDLRESDIAKLLK